MSATTTATAIDHDDDDNEAFLVCCPLCTETMMLAVSTPQKYYYGRLPLKVQGQKPISAAAAAAALSPAIQRIGCCQQYVCQSCLYRHVTGRRYCWWWCWKNIVDMSIGLWMRNDRCRGPCLFS
jgi:hypothetical protein